MSISRSTCRTNACQIWGGAQRHAYMGRERNDNYGAGRLPNMGRERNARAIQASAECGVPQGLCHP
eukprot:2251021-Prymnesium_polylepis.1